MFRSLERISLTMKGLLLTLIVGTAAWAALDYFQSRALEGIFLGQLEERLDREAQEDRIRFDSYVKAHHESVKLLVAQKGFMDYVERKCRGWKGAPEGVVFRRELPEWLPKPSVLRSLVRIRYALLLDGKGRVREIYQAVPEAPPGALLKPTKLVYQLSHNQAFMTEIEDVPFLVASESLMEQGEGRKRRTTATLMLASPLDNYFLKASQRPYHGQIFALTFGLVTSPRLNRILVSTHPELLPPGAELDALGKKYLITGKSFFDYGASDLTLGFAAFVPLDEVDSMVGSIISRDRRQRAMTAFILISAFALIMLVITRRIERVAASISDFSRQALLGKPYEDMKGDELHILEKRFHRLTEEVVSSREQLVQSEKLSALGRLTANVAHEIRHPLTSIGGFARRLNRKFPAETVEKEYAEIIISEVDNLEKILRNVLTYSRGTALALESHDPDGIIEESLKIFEDRCLEQSIRVSRDLGDVPEIIVDRIQVAEAVKNLLSNSIDAMPDGGTLTVTAKEETRRGRRYLVVQVADTGQGIPADKVQMIFEPFFTTKILGRGTGLGLSICKKIVEDHGGFIRVESQMDEGSVFTLYLPYDNRGNGGENLSRPSKL
ncbi:MAG: ATP-binding protein [Candidatus Sulfobium sp.]|jgi:signal transduction histidine kinase